MYILHPQCKDIWHLMITIYSMILNYVHLSDDVYFPWLILLGYFFFKLKKIYKKSNIIISGFKQTDHGVNICRQKDFEQTWPFSTINENHHSIHIPEVRHKTWNSKISVLRIVKNTWNIVFGDNITSFPVYLRLCN